MNGQSDGTFTLNGDYALEGQHVVVAGAYAYALHKNGITTPEDGNWYLRSQLVLVPEVPEQPTGPLYQAGIPVYEAYAQGLLNADRLPTLQQRVGNRFWNDPTVQKSEQTLQVLSGGVLKAPTLVSIPKPQQRSIPMILMSGKCRQVLTGC